MGVWDSLRDQSEEWHADQDAKDAQDRSYFEAVRISVTPGIVRSKRQHHLTRRQQQNRLLNTMGLGDFGSDPMKAANLAPLLGNPNKDQLSYDTNLDYAARNALPAYTAKQQQAYFNQNAKSVWMGEKETPDNPKSAELEGGQMQGHAKIKNKAGPKATSITAALNAPTQWTDQKLAEQMAKYGYTDVTAFYSDWRNAVTIAGQSWTGTKGGKSGVLRSPYDILNQFSKLGGGGKGGAGTPTTTTTTSVDNVTEGQAWTYLQSAVEKAIGRVPTTSELHRFLGKARDVAASNPSVTTSTTKTDGKGNSTVHNSQTGGVTEDDYKLAASNMAATPEAAAYQVAGKYMNALMSAIQSPVHLDKI